MSLLEIIPSLANVTCAFPFTNETSFCTQIIGQMLDYTQYQAKSKDNFNYMEGRMSFGLIASLGVLAVGKLTSFMASVSVSLFSSHREMHVVGWSQRLIPCDTARYYMGVNDFFTHRHFARVVIPISLFQQCVEGLARGTLIPVIAL